MIPTKNRPNFILRQLKYYSLSNFQGVILIGDSSDSKFFEENKSNIIDFGKELTIRHLHYPEVTPDKALSYLSSEVQTDYSAFVADDDIILVESILAGINFLDSHLEYSAVHGKALLMSLASEKGEPYGKLNSMNLYPLAIISEDTALGRIKEFFANVANVNMAIVRSKINVDAFKEVEKLSNYYSIYVFGELLHASIVCARGKIGQIDNCYLIRQSHEDQAYSKLSLGEWFSREEWCEQFNILKLTINREILAHDNIEDINNKTSLILSRYIETLVNNIGIKDRISPFVVIYRELKFFLKRYRVMKVLHRLLFKKNILHVVIEDDIDSLNDVRRYIDLIEERNSRK